MRTRELDLDDISAQLRGDLRSVCDDVEGGLAFLADTRAARIGPYDDGEAVLLGLRGDLLQLLVHFAAHRRAGIDGEADRGASQAQGVFNAAGDGGFRIA